MNEQMIIPVNDNMTSLNRFMNEQMIIPVNDNMTSLNRFMNEPMSVLCVTGWPLARIIWPGGISYNCDCGVIFQWDSLIKWLLAGTVLTCVERYVKPNTKNVSLCYRYNEVVKACGLEQDFGDFVSGDLTEVSGQKCITLQDYYKKTFKSTMASSV